MITIIHGDDQASSRTYYISLQKSQARVFDGEKVTKKELEEAFVSEGFFENEKQICLENFFSKRKASTEMDSILGLISASAQQDILLWEGKEIPKKSLVKFPSAITKLFPLPKALFSFLDSIQPKNTKTMLTLYHQTLQQTEEEMVLVMLIRQIRILLALTDTNHTQTIDEVSRMQPWQEKKFISQARMFSKDTLQQVHEKLFTLEVGSKTGGLALPLAQSIDFFLLSL